MYEQSEYKIVKASQSTPSVSSGPSQYCTYCGARLSPDFYFCTVCATPYKSDETVLPRATIRPVSESELISTKAPHVMPLFWTYLAVVVGSGIACRIIFRGGRSDLALLFQTAVLFVTTCIFSVIHWRSLVVQFKRIGFFHLAALFGLLALAPLLAINYAYHSFISDLTGDSGVSQTLLSEAGISRMALIFFFCICPAILEEIAFRGLVQHWLCVALPPARALVLASALFAALHFSLISAPYLFAVGMVLGWTKWKTGSLYPSMLIHFIHNWVVLEYFWN